MDKTLTINNPAEAVQAAAEHLRAFYPNSKDARLEEIEKQSNGWLVTLSFDNGIPQGISPFEISTSSRELKVFEMSNDGVLRSMKIRTLNK